MKMINKGAIALSTILLTACGAGSETIRDPDIDSLFSCGQYLQAKVMDPSGTQQAVKQSMQIIASALDDSQDIHRWYKTRGVGYADSEVIEVAGEYCVEYPRDGINNAIISAAEIVYAENLDNPMYFNCTHYNNGHFNDQDLLRAIELTEIPADLVQTTEMFASFKESCQANPDDGLFGMLNRLKYRHDSEQMEVQMQAEQEEARLWSEEFMARFEVVKDQASNMALPNGGLQCSVYRDAMGMFQELDDVSSRRDLRGELMTAVQGSIETHLQSVDVGLVPYASVTQRGYGSLYTDDLPEVEHCQNNSLVFYYEEMRDVSEENIRIREAQAAEAQAKDDAFWAEREARLEAQRVQNEEETRIAREQRAEEQRNRTLPSLYTADQLRQMEEQQRFMDEIEADRL